MSIHPVAALHKVNAVLIATLKPLGVWGLGGLAFIDSGLFPLPTTMDGVLIGYVASDHGKFLAYCVMAAFASAVGSMIPYYVGRAGGELFLLKRIDRKHYEQMRDKFENQEFMAIMFPAMMPPPMPIKVFEFAAGVFEMKPLLFATAIFSGKLVQFLACALVTIFFGPEIAHTARRAVHEHPTMVIAIVLFAALVLVVFVVRKVMARRHSASAAAVRAESETADDPTLIT